jgi:hypothetical protein
MYVRQREEAPVIKRIGDVFLDAATEFRLAYPIYVGHLPLAEKRMKDEVENNPEFRLFLEVLFSFYFLSSYLNLTASNVHGSPLNIKNPFVLISSIF